MCTAVTYKTRDFYFGRTLDYEFSYVEEVTVTPRHYPFVFREAEASKSHFALIGMAYVLEDYPLYYDAVNEKGLGMAGLNFVGNACYGEKASGKENVAPFELIPRVLGQCATVKEARALLEKTNLIDIPFREDLPQAELHWLIADRNEAMVAEPTGEGLKLYENPVGVLTNNPPFPLQLFALNPYMHLSPKAPENRFSEKLSLHPYSRGMGAIGLPGDLSSGSRFIRAAFAKENALSGESEGESVSQFFHILGTVEQPRGMCEVEDGKFEKTIYTSCMNVDRGIYYYTTYDNHQITAVHMQEENLDGSGLLRYPLILGEQIYHQNGTPKSLTEN